MSDFVAFSFFICCLLCFVCLTAWLLGRGEIKDQYMQKNGIAATAKVITVDKTIVEYGKGFSTKKLMYITLMVEDNEGGRKVNIDQAMYPRDIPAKGDTVNVLVDPRDLKNVIITSIIEA